MAHLSLYVSDFTSSKDAIRLEDIFNYEIGISLKASFTRSKLSFRYEPKLWNNEKIKDYLTVLGYHLIDKPKQKAVRLDPHEVLFLLLLFIGLPILIHDYCLINKIKIISDIKIDVIIQSLLAGIFILALTTFYIKKIFSSIKEKVIKSSIPLLIGVIGLYGTSIYAIINHEITYDIYLGNIKYFYIVLISLLFVFTKIVQHQIMVYTLDIKTAANLYAPNTVNKQVGEEIIKVELKDLVKGDIIVCYPGQMVPVDGKLVEDNIYFDASIVSGDYRPAHKHTNDQILAGNIVLRDTIHLQVLDTTDDSFLIRMQKLMEIKRSSKNQTTRTLERITPWVILSCATIGLLSFLIRVFFLRQDVYDNLITLFSIMIVAIPMGGVLSVAIPLLFGLGKSNGQGIICNNQEVFLDLKHIFNVVYSYNGVVTQGNFKVVTNNIPSDYNNLIYSIEKHSKYYVSSSLVEYYESLKANLITNLSFEDLDGGRVKVSYNGDSYYVGSYRFISTLINDPVAKIWSINTEALSKKQIPLFFVKNNEYIGYLCLEDQLRASIRSTIILTKQSGLVPYVLLTDNKIDKKALSDRISLNEDNIVYCETIQDKIQFLQKLKNDSGVCFVGDSLSDAPLNIRADVSFCMKVPYRQYAPTTSVTLLNQDVTMIPRFIRYANNLNKIIFINKVLSIVLPLISLILVLFNIMNLLWITVSIVIALILITFNSFRLRGAII